MHTEHGIGRYEGLQKLSVEGVRNDFLALTYHGGDKLYLPVDRMGMVQKYMGVEGHTPGLDKLGGKSWERVMARVKRSAEKMAGELLKLYARAQGRDRVRLRRGGRLLPGFRSRVCLRRDAGSAQGDRRGAGGYAADGPRWTDWSAGTSATVRPRWRSGLPSWRSTTGSRWPSWCPRRSWRSSTTPPSAAASNATR